MKNEIKILHYDCVHSTNTVALDLQTSPHLLTLVADRQTGGRGRMGRAFFSDHEGLYMSVVIDPEKVKCGLSLCTPAAAVAVREALENAGIDGTKIKWVNDLLLDGRKVCGILTEARSAEGKISKIVVGIGVNLQPPENGFPEEIRDKAGAVNFTGDKMALAEDIAQRLGRYVEADSEAVLEKYRRHLAFLGERITATDYADGNKQITGTVQGISDKGFLLLKTDDGEIRALSSGEITQ